MGHQVVIGPGSGEHVRQQSIDFRLVAGRPQGGQLRVAGLLQGGVDREQVERDLLFLFEGIHADYDFFVRFDALLELVSRFADLALDVAVLDGLKRAAERVHLPDIGHDAFFNGVGELFDVVGAGQRVDAVSRAGLMRDDLLGAQGDLDRFFGGQREGFVHAVGVERLGAAEHGRQGLQGGADDVVLGLLGGEGRAAGLGVEAHHHRAFICRAKAFLHQARPDAAGGAELGDLFQEVVVAGEEEGELGGEVIHRQAFGHRGLDIGDGVDEGEGQLLHGGGARFADVIAGDADRVPARDFLPAVGKDIGDEAHGGFGREDVGAAGDVFLEDVVLDRAAQLIRAHALLLGHGDVHGEQDGGGRVDGHAGGDLVERDAGEELLHIVNGGDGDADLADLARRHDVIAVITDLGGQVEGDREAGLALVEQEAVALVGFLGGGVAGVLAHGPEAPAVHGGLDAAREGVLAGEAELLEVAALSRESNTRDIDAGGGLEFRLALGVLIEDGVERLALPLVVLVFDLFFHSVSYLSLQVYLMGARGRRSSLT